MLVKEKLYNFFVRKNGRVWYEYERYVREHMEEHHLHRFSHIIVLLKLNWFYRVKKGNTPYLYWDVPLNPEVEKVTEIQKVDVPKIITKSVNQSLVKNNQVWKSNAFFGSESKSYSSWKEVHLVKRFLIYDAVVFNVFDTLVYSAAGSKRNFFCLLEKEFNIPKFAEYREKAEIEAINLAKKKGKEATIQGVYIQLRKYTKVDINQGVKRELEVLKSITYPNAYMKSFYDMLSYNFENICVMEETLYSSEQIKELLMHNGFPSFVNIFVSNEICAKKNNYNFFGEVSNRLNKDNIIYMSASKRNREFAQMYGWNIWEYRNANEIGKQFRPQNLQGKAVDSYKSIVNQRLYCGHYQHSPRRELGYVYFGVVMLGFIAWIKKQCVSNDINRIAFVYGTGEILQENYNYIVGKDALVNNMMLISEEIAVRCLVDVEPSCYMDFYIDRKINGNYTISYYMERMGLRNLQDILVDYGISPTDIMKLNNEVYFAFIDFISDNLAVIKRVYENEIRGICRYLENQGFDSGNIAIINIRGKGYIGKALSWLLNNRMNIECRVVEFNMFQTINSDAVWYSNGTLQSYVFLKENIISGFKLPINMTQGNYFESVYSDRKPRLSGIEFNEEQDSFVLQFCEAYPWRYDGVLEIQRGIRDFVNDYFEIWKANDEMLEFTSEEIILILRNIISNNDYLKKMIPIIYV